MSKLNIIGYGIAFGALFCALATSIYLLIYHGDSLENVKFDRIMRDVVLINLVIGVAGAFLTGGRRK